MATSKEVDFRRERNRGTTPRDKDKQCDVCGVEKIEFVGTEVLSGLVLYTGERCAYYIKRSDDFKALP